MAPKQLSMRALAEVVLSSDVILQTFALLLAILLLILFNDVRKQCA